MCLLASTTLDAVIEQCTYDADDERIQRIVTQNGQSTINTYIGGLYEQEDPSGTMRTSYTLNGQVVAQKETAVKGLRAELYATTGLTPADLKLVRIDGEVNFDWGTGSPAPSGAMPSDNFSIRWTGKVQPSITGTYNFYTFSDDGVRLWVNGVLLVDNWTIHPPTENVGAITLTGGQQYDIKVEYYEGGMGALMKLSWAPPAGRKEVIPVSQLIPPAPTSTVTYLHSDHLGSVSVATNSAGTVVSRQQYDPWGKVRSGGVGHTDLNYTGQRKDDTGLLYYHARYYDPGLARFVSPDSIVPGASSGVGGAGGSLGVYQNRSLAVDFHERDFISLLQEEHKFTLEKGFWFQRSEADKKDVTDIWGPQNPQALNRYSYALNNPVRYIDPSGHAAIVLAAIPIGVLIALAAAGVSALMLAVWLSDADNRESLASFLEGSWDNISATWNEFVDAIKANRPMEVRDYRGDTRTAEQIIGSEKKGSINSEFPEEWKGKTFDEIDKAAKAGNRSARTARKLLTAKEYDKGSKR